MPEKLEYIPHSRPTLGEGEAAAVSEVIASGYIAQGERVETFETALAETIGVPHAAAVNSGTSALHLTLLAMGVGTGDEVIMPSYVCTALLNAVRYTGAEPIISDVLSDTYNIDPEDARRKLTIKTKAIIVPHMFGLPADLGSLTSLDVPIIEDCAQAIGSTLGGQPAGAFGDVAVFSFYATKMIATGEGGMVVSRNKDLVKRIKALRDYDNREVYRIRFNYKMTDIQAALGLVQFSRLPAFIKKRREIAGKYDFAFHSKGIRIPAKCNGHIYYRYIVDTGRDATELIDDINLSGIGCDRPVFRPLHRYWGTENCRRTEIVWNRAVSIPIYPSLSNLEIDRIINAVTKYAYS